MDAIRLSASDLDAYRRFRANEDAELADLIAHLRRETPPSEAMEAGTALHAALEIADPGAEFERMEANGYTFDMQIEGEIDMPAIRERKETREFMIGRTLATLVGKVDAIHGQRIEDHKFTGRFDPERFMASMQWRVYLTIFGANEFRWNIFEGREIAPKHYVISAFHQLRMHRYPGMERDVEHEVAQFIEFARCHLPERLTPREPLSFEYLGVG